MRSRFLAPATITLSLGLVFSLAIPAHASATEEPAPTAGEVAPDALAIYEALAESDDPASAYAALTVEEAATFQSYFFLDEVEESVTLTPIADGLPAQSTTYSSIEEADAAAAAACYTRNVKYTGTSAVGLALWDVWVEGTWCGTPGEWVNSISLNRSWSTIAAIGWRDGGEIDKGTGLSSNGLGKMWAQRRMVFGIGGWDAQEIRPCVRLIGYSDGYYVGDSICGTA